MPEGDVRVRIELIPTESSMRKAAQNFVDSIEKGLSGISLSGVLDATKKTAENLGIAKKAVSGDNEAKGEAVKQTNLLKEIVNGISIANIVWSTFADFLKPIFALLKIILVLLFLPLIPILIPALKALSELVKILSPISQKTMQTEQEGGAKGAATTLGAVGGGIIGGIAGSFFGPIGTAAGAAIGAGLGAMLVNVIGEALAGFVLSLVDFGAMIGQALIDYIISPLVSFGGLLGQGLIDAVVALLVWVALLPQNLEKFLTGLQSIFDFILNSVFNSEIWKAIEKMVQFILVSIFGKEGIWGVIEKTINFLLNNVFNLEAVWNGIFSTIQLIASALKIGLDAINSAVNAGKQALEIAGKVGSALNPFDDFIIRPGSGAVPFSPDDTIIGVKNPGALGGGGITINNTFNVEAGLDSSELKRIFDDFARKQAQEIRNRVSYPAGFYS
jgi:hypothetical protein